MVLKKNKKYIIIALALSMLVAITGCGNKVPKTQDLMTTAYTNTKSQASMETKLVYSLDAELEANEKTIPFKIESNIITQALSEKDITHSEGTYDISIAGKSQSIKINTYTSKTETSVTTYAQNEKTEEWTYLTQTFNAERDEFNPFKIISNHQDIFTASETIVTYNERECYEIKGNATGDILKEFLTGVLSSDDLIKNLEEMDLSEVTAEVTMLVYKNESLPAVLRINFTDGLQSIVNKSLETLNTKSEVPLKANVNDFTITFSYEKFGTCNELIIPVDIPKIAEEYKETTKNWSLLNDTTESKPENNNKPENDNKPEIPSTEKEEEKDIYDDTPDGEVAADSDDNKVELDKTSSEIGTDWKNFEFNYNNTTMYLPTSYITFKTYTNYQVSNADDDLASGETVKCKAKLGTNTISLTITNTTEETKKVSECTVVAVYFDSYALNEKELAKIIFAGNITMSSVKDDVIAAYGEPISIGSSSMLDIYEYKMSEDSTNAIIKVYIDKENGSVVEYRIINN